MSANSGESDLHSVIGLMALGLEKGVTVKISVSGPDEQAMCKKLVDLFEYEFDFPPRDDGSAPFS